MQRPGALERSAEGLTAKVLAERLAKLVGFGMIEKKAFDESPPRVEYHFTPLGECLVVVLDQLEGIRREFHSGVRDDPGKVPVTGPS